MTFYLVDTQFRPVIDLRCVGAAASWAALMLRRWWVPKSLCPSSSLASCQEAAHPSSRCRLRLFFFYISTCVQICGGAYALACVWNSEDNVWGLLPSFCCVAQGSGSGCHCWQPSSPVRPPHLSGRLTGAELDLFEDPLPCFLQELLHPHSPNGAQNFNFCTLLSTFESVFVSFPYCREKNTPQKQREGGRLVPTQSERKSGWQGLVVLSLKSENRQ